MKKPCLLGMFLLCLAGSTFAQGAADSSDLKQLKVNTLSDSGRKANNLSFTLMLFDYRFKKHDDYTSQYIANSLTFGFSYNYENKFKIAGGYSYLNALPAKAQVGEVNTNYPGTPSNGSRERQHLELSYTRYFHSFITQKTTKIKLKKEKGLNYYVSMPYHKLTLIGWKIELMDYKTSATSDDFNFNAYDVADPKKTVINLPWSYSVINMDMTWVNLGASITNIVDTRYSSKYGQRMRHHISTMYADLIVAPYIYYYDVQGTTFQWPQPPTYVFRRVNVNDNTPHQRLGCKVGYSYCGNGPVGMGVGAEAGISPGPKFNPYVSLRVYVPIFSDRG